MATSYIVDRMLAEFAAAAMVLAADVLYNPIDEDSSNGEGEGGIPFSTFKARIEDILQRSYPHVLPYFSRCLDSHHKDFLWTGPQVQIVPRSEDFISVIPVTTMGELRDFPGHQIYSLDADLTVPAPITPVGKRQHREDIVDGQPKKQKR